MKRFLCIVMICFVILFNANSKTVTTEDGCLSFEVPEECGCIDIHHRNPRSLQIAGYCSINFRDNINSYGRPLYFLLKKNNFKFNYSEVKHLLQTNNYQETGDFTLTPNYNQEYIGTSKQYIGYLPKSYKPIIREDIIGEEYMYAMTKYSVFDKYGGDSIGYHVTFCLNDRLERISFTRIISDGKAWIETFPDWYEKRSDGNYYWKNQECLNEMYDLLFSDDYKKLPRDLQLIRETRDMILQTVRVNDPPVDTSNMQEGVITH